MLDLEPEITWASTLFTVSYLDADTASDAELLGDDGDLVIGRHLDTELAHAHHRARALALLATSLRLAAVAVDDGDTGELAALLLSAPLRHGCPASPCRVRRDGYMGLRGLARMNATCCSSTGRVV